VSNKKKTFAPGEVINVDLGKIHSSEVKGHEQGGYRPCVVIKSLHRIGLVIIVPCTTQKPKNTRFYFVEIPADGKMLTKDSHALCHQIRVISIDRIAKKRGKLSESDFNKIRFVLMDLLELE